MTRDEIRDLVRDLAAVKRTLRDAYGLVRDAQAREKMRDAALGLQGVLTVLRSESAVWAATEDEEIDLYCVVPKGLMPGGRAVQGLRGLTRALDRLSAGAYEVHIARCADPWRYYGAALVEGERRWTVEGPGLVIAPDGAAR